MHIDQTVIQSVAAVDGDAVGLGVDRAAGNVDLPKVFSRSVLHGHTV